MEKTGQFEELVKKLEDNVRKLEGGSLSLEESLKIFEEGVGIARKCQEFLKNAEQKVEILVKKSEGAVSFEPFESEE